MRFRITVKYYNKENKIDTFTTFTDKAIKGRELEDFVKQFLKESKIMSVVFESVDENGSIVGKNGKLLRKMVK